MATPGEVAARGAPHGAGGQANSLPPNATARAVDDLVDPLNRYYRYPLCEALAPLLKNVNITPNQITVFHSCIGLAAGALIAHGSRTALVIACLFGELRMLLDCLDGVVARSKKLFHPYGRTIDEIGDAVGVSGMMIGVYLHCKRGGDMQPPSENAGYLFCGVLAIAGIMAWGYDFFKRRFLSALRDNEDGIVLDLSRKVFAYSNGANGFLATFGLGFDWMQILVLSPRTRIGVLAEVKRLRQLSDAERDDAIKYRKAFDTLGDVAFVRRSADSASLRRTLRIIAWVSGDNLVVLLNLGLLTGCLVKLQQVMIAYGLTALFVGAVTCGLFFRGRSPAARSTTP
jgi:hypothetical protein